MPNVQGQAAVRGFEDQVLNVVFEQATPTQLANWLQTPVDHAARSGNDSLVTKLVRAGAHCSMALHSAIRWDRHDLVDDLLLLGAEDDCKIRKNGEAPIHVAAELGREHILRSLLLKGANKNEVNSEVMTPLQLAVTHGHVRAVKVLLLAGADMIHRDGLRESALDLAAHDGRLDVLQELLQHGFDADARDFQLGTALHCAVESDKPGAVEALLEAGADADFTTGSYLWTPLISGCGNGVSLATVRALVKGGANTNAVDTQGGSPLHLAALDKSSHRCHPELVDTLLRWGADETAVNAMGHTPESRLSAAASPIYSVLDDYYGELKNRDRALQLLVKAPADRAWRRRGLPILCRAYPNRVRLAPAESNRGSGKLPKADTAVGVGLAIENGSCSMAGGGSARDESTAGDLHGVTARLLVLEEVVFRIIVGFL